MPVQNAILSSNNFSIIATDEHGIIQFFNRGAQRMLGYSADEVVNKLNPSDLQSLDELMARAVALSIELGSTIKPGFEALVCKASRGSEDVVEMTYVRKDGSTFPSLVSISAMRDEAEKIVGYLLIGSDDSVRAHVQVELTTARAAAEKASLAKSDFLIQISHELRTPLNIILGFAQLMETGFPAPSPSQKQNLTQILKAGRYLLELTNEILDRALLESGKVTLSHEPVSLAEVLFECRSMIESPARRRRIEISFPQFDIPRFIRADRTRVKQVLMNLLVNAIKYNTAGGSVVVECTRSPDTPELIRVSVRDTGKGLVPEQVAQLFQPFNRLGQEAGDEEGTGMGLVVSKQLVEMMGGTIGADSVSGSGTVVWFELYAATAPSLTIPEGAAAARMPAQMPDGALPRTVLYVEDNPANLELIKQLIARYPDLRLITATNGSIGIESARANQPEVILMDINMPGMNGIDAMRVLRRDPATAHIPIIALSANAMASDIENGLKAGFFNYITKPIKFNECMAALDAALAFSQIAAGRTTTEKPV